MAHNHPSGSLSPSEADLDISIKIAGALEACGIAYVDHLIITNEGYYSMKADKSYPFPGVSDEILPVAAELRAKAAQNKPL